MNTKKKTGIEIEVALKALPSETLLTKKEIEELTGLSDNTVVTTLSKCGVPTSSRSYRVLLLLERFVPARKILDEGGTYEKVEEFAKTFSPLKSDEEEEGEEGGDLSLALDQFTEDAAEALYEAIEDRAERLIVYMPSMYMQAMSGAILKGAGRQKLKTELLRVLKSKSNSEISGQRLKFLRSAEVNEVDVTPRSLPASDEEPSD